MWAFRPGVSDTPPADGWHAPWNHPFPTNDITVQSSAALDAVGRPTTITTPLNTTVAKPQHESTPQPKRKEQWDYNVPNHEKTLAQQATSNPNNPAQDKNATSAPISDNQPGTTPNTEPPRSTVSPLHIDT